MEPTGMSLSAVQTDIELLVNNIQSNQDKITRISLITNYDDFNLTC